MSAWAFPSKRSDVRVVNASPVLPSHTVARLALTVTNLCVCRDKAEFMHMSSSAQTLISGRLSNASLTVAPSQLHYSTVIGESSTVEWYTSTISFALQQYSSSIARINWCMYRIAHSIGGKPLTEVPPSSLRAHPTPSFMCLPSVDHTFLPAVANVFPDTFASTIFTAYSSSDQHISTGSA